MISLSKCTLSSSLPKIHFSLTRPNFLKILVEKLGSMATSQIFSISRKSCDSLDSTNRQLSSCFSSIKKLPTNLSAAAFADGPSATFICLFFVYLIFSVIMAAFYGMRLHFIPIFHELNTVEIVSECFRPVRWPTREAKASGSRTRSIGRR